MRYINAHLTGRPLHTYLWFIWLFGGMAWVLYAISRDGTRFSGKAGFCAVVCAGLCGLLILKLIAISRKEVGKEWLNSIYQKEEHQRARIDMKGLVIIVPILVALALLAPLLFDDVLL